MLVEVFGYADDACTGTCDSQRHTLERLTISACGSAYRAKTWFEDAANVQRQRDCLQLHITTFGAAR